MRSLLSRTLRDPWLWLRALGWPLLVTGLLVWGTASAIDAELRGGFAAEPLRLAVFTEAPAPGLLDWLAARPGVALRTDVEPMRFRELVRTDSLDAAWIVAADFAEAVAAGGTGEIRQFSDPQALRTAARLDRLLDAYRTRLLETRLRAAGLPAAQARPLALRQTDAGGGLLALTDTLVATVLLLAAFFALLTLGHVLRRYRFAADARRVVEITVGWSLLAAFATPLGLRLGTWLVGAKATPIASTLDLLWQPAALGKWALLSAPALLLLAALGAYLLRSNHDHWTHHRRLRLLQTIAWLGLLGTVLASLPAVPLFGWVAAGADWLEGVIAPVPLVIYPISTCLLAALAYGRLGKGA